MKSNISIYISADKIIKAGNVTSDSKYPIEIICTNIHLNPELEKQITKIANDIYLSTKQNRELQNHNNPDKVQLELDLVTREFKVNKNKSSSMGKHALTQVFLILIELLTKGEIHWTTGFILFENWQIKSPTKVVEQFRKIVARLNKFIGHKILIPQKENPKGSRCWEIDKNIEISTKTKKAKDIMAEIEDLENINQINKLLLMTFYSYPDSVEISRIFVNLIKKRNLEIKETIKDRLWDAHSILKTRKDNLKSGIKKIKIEGDKINWLGDYKEAEKYLREMEDELNTITSAYDAAEDFLSNTKKNEDEIKYCNLANQLEAIREGNKSMIDKFMREKSVDICLTKTSARFKKWANFGRFKNLDFNEIKQEAFIGMLAAIKGEKGGRINLKKIRDFRTSESIINYISEIVYYRLIRSFIKQEIGIEENKQNYFWEFLKTQKNLIENNIPTDDDKILKELNKKSSVWNLEMIYEMKSYEDKIKINIDITNEQKYYDKVLEKNLYEDELNF